MKWIGEHIFGFIARFRHDVHIEKDLTCGNRVSIGATAVTGIAAEDNMSSDSVTNLCTQQSIKAYADTKLPLAGGTMTGSVNFGDNDITNVDSLDADKLSIAGGTEMVAVNDEDDMSSNSATALATQQSIKAYTDAKTQYVFIPFLGNATTPADGETYGMAGTFIKNYELEIVAPYKTEIKE